MTGTYTSTNARPCANCGLRAVLCVCDRRPRVPVIPGHIGLPTDAYVISQPLPAHEVVETYIPPVDTPAGGLSWTGVMNALDKQPQRHSERRSARGTVPVWAMACVFVGLVLMALCAVMLTVVMPARETFGR